MYNVIDTEKIRALQIKHAWIVEPIYRASEHVKTTPFFDWINNLTDPVQFKDAALPLYYHSATFPKVMGLMLGLTPMSENFMMPFYATHAYGEAHHHQMLMRWMLEFKIVNSKSEIDDFIPNTETNACVNYAYQMAIEQDRDKWLVGLNSGIERCSNEFFKIVAPKMHALNAGDEYFDVHVEADEHHSIMGLEYIEQQNPDSQRGEELIHKALEGIELWGRMLNSWIGEDIRLKFNFDGKAI